MNDKGKGKVTVATSSPAVPDMDTSSPMPVISNILEMLSDGKGKSKELHEPLPGRSLPVSPSIHLMSAPRFRVLRI